MALEEIVKTLIVYGPLGIFCAIFLGGYIQKDRASVKMQKDFLDKQEALMNAHKSEMQALEERYVAKAETWMEKYRERADAQHQLLDALYRKVQGS